MKENLTAVAALAAGAAAMYFLDPDRGRRRRALARDRFVSTSHRAGDLARARGRRAADRLEGLMAKGRARLMQSPPADDRQLHERIRSKLGRLVSHPRAIDVEVHDGHVRLGGHILNEDVDSLLSGVSAMRGVRGIDNRLLVHDEPGNLPQLQGASRPNGAAGPSMGTVLPLVALAAAPLAIVLGATGRVMLHRRNGARTGG